jgi:2-polyprenyl-3-methyl-5-hydroxy-6-metoxy-1,4-benzoquinol methylase
LRAVPRSRAWFASGIKTAGFVGTLVAAPVVWLGLMAVFAAPAVLAFSVRALLGRLTWNGTHRWRSEPPPDDHMEPAGAIIFDRRRDVSKLEGCNTRNVQFRWNIFSRWTAKLLQRRPSPSALDVGAGSLRDTFELAVRGMEVDALDVNAQQLQASWKAYDWSRSAHEPRLMTGPLAHAGLAAEAYDLVLAFDIIEHLRDLEGNLAVLARAMSRDGLLFVSVPNRRAALERLFRAYQQRSLSRGIVDTSGVPHVNFKSPEEWKDAFRQAGLVVLDHEMAIGFLVNDIWQATFAIPMRTFVDPVIQHCCTRLGRPFRAGLLERLFYPRWWMRLVNELDEALKPLTHPLWGWNLLVLGRSRW